MRRLFLLLLPLFLSAEDFTTLLHRADKNLLLQAKREESRAKEALYHAARSKNYPTITASLQALYLKDRPTMFLHLPIPGVPPEFQVGTQQRYTGEIALSYPIFSGFAISSLIEKTKLDAEKSKLQLQDAKRNLYLQIATLYGTLHALDAAVGANKEALKAIEASYKKANGFFRAGLLAPSELENIKAKKFETKAVLQKLLVQRKNLLKQLSYLTDSEVATTGALPAIAIHKPQRLIALSLKQREDLRVLEKLLEMDEKDLTLARSSRYPTLALVGALKTEGESIKLNGDGYSNPNKSYIGLVAKWRLFDGFESSYRIDAAKAKKMGRLLYLQDYRNRIKTELETELENLEAIESEKEARSAQLLAQQSYYRLTRGRFENRLASADELSRAIAARAGAQAGLEAVKAQLFIQKCRILLQTSLQRFESRLLR